MPLRRLIKKLTGTSSQVHADASRFAQGVGKEEALRQVLDQVEGLIDGQRNWVCFYCMWSLFRLSTGGGLECEGKERRAEMADGVNIEPF